MPSYSGTSATMPPSMAVTLTGGLSGAAGAYAALAARATLAVGVGAAGAGGAHALSTKSAVASIRRMLIDLPSPAGQQHTRRNRRALARSLEVRPTFEVTWEDIEYLPGLLPRVYQPRGQGSFRAVLEAG